MTIEVTLFGFVINRVSGSEFFPAVAIEDAPTERSPDAYQLHHSFFETAQ